MILSPLTADKPLDKPSAPGTLAAGLMYSDRKLLAILYPLLIAPPFVQSLMDRFTSPTALSLAALERVLELVVLCLICRGWLRRLSIDKRVPEFRSYSLIFLFGILLWALIFLPPAIFSVLLGLDPSGYLAPVAFMGLFLPGIFLSYRCYMYFFPVLFSGHNFPTAVRSSSAFLEGDPYLPLKILAPSAGIASLLLSLCAAPFPDGRELSLTLLGEIFGGLFWVLSCYLSLAFALLKLSDKDWHDLNLDPYREARFATISLQAPSFIPPLITAKSGARLVAVSALIWIGNFLRVEILPPAAVFQMKDVNAEGDTVTLALEVQDARYKLRGIQPAQLRIAGERYLESGDQAAVICRSPKTVESPSYPQSSSDELKIDLPATTQPVPLKVTFTCTRSGNALTDLEDLYLWYRHLKLFPVKFRR